MTGMSGENFLLYLKEVQAVGDVQNKMQHLINQVVDNLPVKGQPGQATDGYIDIMIVVQDLRIPIDNEKKRYFNINVNYKCSLPPAWLPQVRKLDMVITWATEYTKEEWNIKEEDDKANQVLMEAFNLINKPKP